MIRFNNDYSRGAHDRILKALCDINGESYGGYGLDSFCLKASELIKKLTDSENADVHFFVGGTQANFTVIASALRPYQSVVAPETGHINVHETGAVENTGHKVTAIPAINGKITAEQISETATLYENSDIKEHIVCPKMVYISFPTEYGTVYGREELKAIYETGKQHGLYLFIDGARLSYGLGAAGGDVKIEDIAEFSDVFYIGGTKCGALFGEAVVITNDELKTDFRSYIKQNGAMLAKGWLLGVQFYELLKDGLYFSLGERADRLGAKIKEAFNKAGIASYMESPTNQQFFIFRDDILKELSKKYLYEFEKKTDSDHSCVRFCTSWYTEESEAEELIKDVRRLMEGDRL